MGFEFGSAFSTGPAPASLDERLHTIADQLEALVALLAGGSPAPRPLPPADPLEAVQAVQALKGPATATEIAEALTDRLAPSTPASDAAGVLAAVEDLTKILDHRLRGLGAAFGAGGTAHIANITVAETGLAQESTLAGKATESTLVALKRGITGDDQRLDYDLLNNLIYSGKAPAGALTSDGTWVILKLTYTGSNLTYIQQKTGSWDNRASLGW